MSAQPVEAQSIKPDWEMRNLIRKIIQQHPRAIWRPDGTRHSIACPCGWVSPEGAMTRHNRFIRHQSWAIETAISEWLDSLED